MAAETGSQKSSDSGKVYDFKDSKTSGVVTVTKTWDDSMSNDERPVPDISISTSKPGKNPLGYTITYHGNGLTFADGSSENEIVVNSSGKILSGSFKLPDGLFAGWYSDKTCTKRVETDSNGLPVDGLVSDMDFYAKTKTFVLKKGSDFNKLISSTATSVIFTDETMPTSAALIDADADGDEGVVAWMDGTVMKVSTQTPGRQVIADTNCYQMFASKKNLISIDFSNLNTNNITVMSSMFDGCRGLVSLDLTPLDTQNVTYMNGMFNNCNSLTNLDLTPLDTQNVINIHSMFSGCSGLTNLDLTPLDTHKVTNMAYMFDDCRGLTNLDLTHLDTQNVTDMNYMFYGCTALTNLSLGEKFAFVGSNYQLPSGTWYSSNGTAYTSDGNSCTIPNNKADTYTRR